MCLWQCFSALLGTPRTIRLCKYFVTQQQLYNSSAIWHMSCTEMLHIMLHLLSQSLYTRLRLRDTSAVLSDRHFKYRLPFPSFLVIKQIRSPPTAHNEIRIDKTHGIPPSDPVASPTVTATMPSRRQHSPKRLSNLRKRMRGKNTNLRWKDEERRQATSILGTRRVVSFREEFKGGCNYPLGPSGSCKSWAHGPGNRQDAWHNQGRVRLGMTSSSRKT